jgi:uncharacterized membrane protein HdeD (DUF308 family)
MRQLRMSMFLQAAAGIMLSIACIVRLITSGPDALAVVFGLGAVVTGAIAAVLARSLRGARATQAGPP